MGIIRHRRLERPLPHLSSAIQPESMDAIRAGFLTMCGIDYYDAGSGCEPHFHDCDEYWFILEGRAAIECGDETGEVVAGDIVHTPWGLQHVFRALTDTGVLWIYGELHGKKRVGHLHDEDR
jgi:mannose-6-phosphate isomerase-like protein (cupin superfamily)